MAFLKYALPVLAATHAVLADSCGSGDKITIKSQSDADGFASCKTLQGDVVIDQDLSGSLSLSGVQQIAGSFTAKNASQISAISADSLTEIRDTFKLNGLTGLHSLSFAELTKVGSIQWTALPELQTLDFTKGVAEAGNVAISNTGLVNLNGISLKTCGDFDITDNTHLKEVNVNELTNATGLINFAGNMRSLQIELPNLSSGTNMTFRNVSSVSVPSLHNLTGQLGFWGNTFESFEAANLSTTGDLVFNDNSKLDNLTLPLLKTVHGGFQLARDDKLTDISFPTLDTITGALDFAGAFDRVDLPALQEVKGGFNMQSTGNFSCSDFNHLSKNGAIRGTYKCSAKTSNPTTKDGKSGSSTSSGSGSSSTTSGIAVSSNNVPTMGMAAAFFGFLLQFTL